MKEIRISSRKELRNWLSKNHDKEKEGIWLVFYKKDAGRPTMEYEEAVEEALCFGWIDSIIKRLDETTYCRKFTPRKPNSKWSALNKARVARLIRKGKMTASGFAKIEAAKQSGLWDVDPRPNISFDLPVEFSKALNGNKRAKSYFERLSPTYKKQFIGWIVTAKRPETKEIRIRESISLLEQGMKLGLR